MKNKNRNFIKRVDKYNPLWYNNIKLKKGVVKYEIFNSYRGRKI